MGRKKKDRDIWQCRFNLYSDNPLDVRVHEVLERLTDEGKAADFIREALDKAAQSLYQEKITLYPDMPNPGTRKSNPGTSIVQGNNSPERAYNPVPKPTFGKKSRKPSLAVQGVAEEEPILVDIETA